MRLFQLFVARTPRPDVSLLLVSFDSSKAKCDQNEININTPDHYHSTFYIQHSNRPKFIQSSNKNEDQTLFFFVLLFLFLFFFL
jgi:hypothetical protein